MRSNLHPTNPVVTFVHQMIPHHKNAINMAKALMTEDTLSCSDAKESDCDMENVLWAIVNEQNHQIATMSSWLEEYGYEASDICTLDDDSSSNETTITKNYYETNVGYANHTTVKNHDVYMTKKYFQNGGLQIANLTILLLVGLAAVFLAVMIMVGGNKKEEPYQPVQQKPNPNRVQPATPEMELTNVSAGEGI